MLHTMRMAPILLSEILKPKAKVTPILVSYSKVTEGFSSVSVPHRYFEDF